ncbi:ATP-binding protein [Pseudoflavonifractor phocaeensis]|uniref:ATP-binding protein n=1 Tax=Pseudoflavonifractor phocaeensis TaxID=1870988 RepID=UPI0019561E3F|nr:ATP-binding protein [Pseudoflavonifractor phocaeensis]MBM6938713.1 ATP-binding protein [Pseudoflavonifractor phocaeensis]
MESCEGLFRAFPTGPDWRIDWAYLERESPLAPLAAEMKSAAQEKRWHGEGDVWTHTRMVCEALASLEEFRTLAEADRLALFLAALLHDVGKTRCTRLEEGCLTSPHHGAVGANLARALLWRELDLAGTAEKQRLRETVCQLVRYHTAPVHLWKEEEKTRLRRIAANGALIPGFRLSLLCLLAKADLLGRVAEDRERLLEQVELTALLAQEQGCFSAPGVFASPYAQRAYFAGRLSWAGDDPYDRSWGEVILLSGLPGTGKDTWISRNCPALPVVSLDVLRAQLGQSAKGDQSAVAAAAQELARSYLRRKEPFVWNTTSLTPALREKVVSLCERYGAAVRIVFLETGWEEGLRRNGERKAEVPRQTVERMLERLTPPERWEARQVAWLCV